MAAKGTSEAIKTPAEQDEIRRAAKANRTHRKRDFRLTETLAEGIAQDRLKQRVNQMLDTLNQTMTSSSPATRETLFDLVTVYLSTYSQPSTLHPIDRHRLAKVAALNDVSPTSLRNYAERKLNDAEWATRPSR